jgi:MFS family permease
VNRTFAALSAPAYRRFFAGQAISLPGTWMQTVAQGWLVIQLTDSGTMLGAVTAAQFVPVLLLAPYGGLLADRFPKRKLLLATQATMGLTALTLGLLTVTQHVTILRVLIAAVVLGLATAVDNPARQSFVSELVEPALVRNAVTLNSVLINAARAVGPAIAGILIAAVGAGWCFLLNAGSFIAVIFALLSLAPLRPPHPRAPGHSGRQILDGFRYVATHSEVLWPFLVIFIVGTLAWEFPITLPLMARTTFHGDARTYGWLTSAMGAGAVAGGLIVARFGTVGLGAIAAAATLLGTSIALLSVAPTLGAAALAAVAVGWGGTSFMSVANATMQLASSDEYRGRVMALWSLSFAGSTPLGGPIVGALGEYASPRWAIAAGAAACALATLLLLFARRHTRTPEPAPR